MHTGAEPTAWQERNWEANQKTKMKTARLPGALSILQRPRRRVEEGNASAAEGGGVPRLRMPLPMRQSRHRYGPSPSCGISGWEVGQKAFRNCKSRLSTSCSTRSGQRSSGVPADCSALLDCNHIMQLIREEGGPWWRGRHWGRGSRAVVTLPEGEKTMVEVGVAKGRRSRICAGSRA